VAQPPRIRQSVLFAGLAIDTLGTLAIVLALLLPDLEPYRIEAIIGGLVLMLAGGLVMLRARV
jgi:hypothetical protein